MLSFRTQTDERRGLYLRLSGDIERQLRDAYDRRFKAGETTQSSLAATLDVNRSVIHRRLTGRSNMRISTIADMVWGLGHNINVSIYPNDEITISNSPTAPLQEAPLSAEIIKLFSRQWPGQVTNAPNFSLPAA